MEAPKGQAFHAPVFLENPDGTITEAMPSHLKDKSNQGSRAGGRHNISSDGDSDASNGSWSEVAATSMYQEVDFLYSRHECVLIVLLMAQLTAEVLYDVVYVTRMDSSVTEFIRTYRTPWSARSAEVMYWVIFGLEVGYSVVYFALAMVALLTKRPKNFRVLANWTLFGTVAFVLLAYVDKFNLVVFFLRMLAYVYVRFLQGLTASLMLLPRGPNATP